MFRVVSILRGIFTDARNRISCLNIFYLASMLALLSGSVGATTTVQAAPREDDTIDSANVSIGAFPSVACAHTPYLIPFFARVDRVANLGGNDVDLEGGLGPAQIAVKATSSDLSVAGFHPEVETASAVQNRIGRGVNLLLKTEQPGSATLTITGKIEWTGYRVIFPQIQQPIKVVNCKFRITIDAITAAFATDIVETVVFKVRGEIKGYSDGTLGGDADVTWNAQQASPCLSIVQSIPESKATLYGSLNEDGSKLTVHVTFAPAMMFQQNTITCVLNNTSTQQHQFQARPMDFIVPITGRVVSQPVSIPMGDLSPSGTSIILAEPIEGN